MQRLVSDPFEAFIVRLQEDVKAKTRKFLGEQGLDTELLEVRSCFLSPASRLTPYL